MIFVDDVDEVPPGAPLMLSAHGSRPRGRRGGRGRTAVVNAVCPLVTKVHHELKVRAGKGYTVLYVGHAGHEEAIGTMAVAPEAVRLVERRPTSTALPRCPTPVALLAQTTLPHDEWQGIVERGPGALPRAVDAGALGPLLRHHQPPGGAGAIAGRCDAVVVIGSANSSNTVSLAKVAARRGLPRVLG